MTLTTLTPPTTAVAPAETDRPMTHMERTLAEADIRRQEEAAKRERAFLHAPDPVGHYMLVALPDPERKTRGGILLTDEYVDNDRIASVFGVVLAMGPDCFQGTFPNGVLRFPTGPWCQTGDHVLFPRYSGHRIRISDVEFRVLADDQIIGTLDDDARKEISGL